MFSKIIILDSYNRQIHNSRLLKNIYIDKKKTAFTCVSALKAFRINDWVCNMDPNLHSSCLHVVQWVRKMSNVESKCPPWFSSMMDIMSTVSKSFSQHCQSIQIQVWWCNMDTIVHMCNNFKIKSVLFSFFYMFRNQIDW